MSWSKSVGRRTGVQPYTLQADLAMAGKERLWEEKTERLREEERRKAEEEKRQRAEQERQWQLAEQKRLKEDREAEAPIAGPSRDSPLDIRT
ncbi:hypothetical protein PLIIFM63780_001132 [Purpureocillium lilacinum]|nr:hypothetical protein PLIIFM63780_001132 [Purpureocillium lilacinum]